MTSCLDDYTIDSRGDIGSWIRIAACESLVQLSQYLSELDVRDAVARLLRVSVEKMDRVRIAAGKTLCMLIPLWTDAEKELREFVNTYALSKQLIAEWTEIHLESLPKCILSWLNYCPSPCIVRRF